MAALYLRCFLAPKKGLVDSDSILAKATCQGLHCVRSETLGRWEFSPLQGSHQKGGSSKRWLHLYIKVLRLNSWEMGVLTITRIPPKRGNKLEMVEPVYQGSGVKLLGDGSSHHYKDPSERGEEARDGCTCISRICG